MLKQVGNYILTEKIGRGALSRLYRSVDQQGRPVAIKVSTTQAEPEQLESLQRDLVAAASVLHPNVVRIHDLDFADRYPYLVMDLVVGRDFGKVLKSNAPVPLGERLGVMGQIGEALKAAHERQVFHLDVRPSKIMLDQGGVAKLLGLGLGRLSYDPGRDTAQGYLIGSPFYMSPERLAALDIANAQCDIWAFAVTLYELISGKHPFHDEDGDRMIGNIIVDQPLPLAGMPATLNRLILRALAKEPADRYRNFAELLAEFKPTIDAMQRTENEALLAFAAAPSIERTTQKPPVTGAQKSRPAAAMSAPAPAVRVLEFTQSRGLPWGKMLGVAAVGLLTAGLFFYFLRQPDRLIKAVDTSKDAKTLRPAARVIKPNRLEQPVVPAFSQTNGEPAPTPMPPAALNDALDEAAAPRPFDPKSLAWRQPPIRRPVSRLPALAPPTPASNLLLAEAEAAPSIALSALPPPPSLRAAVQPAGTPAQPAEIHPGGSFKEPLLVYSVRPIYPFSAIQKKAQGVVRFQATVTKDGSLKGLRLISGDPLLNNAAKEAVSQWRYRPATLHGEPVEVTQDIIVKFNLDR